MEFLDDQRQRSVSLTATDQHFRHNFSKFTNGILDGMNWANTLAAGEAALASLLDDTPVHEDDEGDDIVLYIYGLNAEQANAKLRHIWEIWRGNLPNTNTQRLVVKNPTSIRFVPDYQVPRIRIELRLYQSAYEVLIGLYPDQCAVAFEGTRAIMLPRCARALETGYSVFKMYLVWGNQLTHWQNYNMKRARLSTNFGFGLRILPAWIRSLEPKQPSHDAEPGLKTMKRLVFMAVDAVARRNTDESVLDSYVREFSESDQERWNGMRKRDRLKYEDLRRVLEIDYPDDEYPPEYEHYYASSSLPNNAQGLGSFEALVQLSELDGRNVAMQMTYVSSLLLCSMLVDALI